MTGLLLLLNVSLCPFRFTYDAHDGFRGFVFAMRRFRRRGRALCRSCLLRPGRLLNVNRGAWPTSIRIAEGSVRPTEVSPLSRSSARQLVKWKGLDFIGRRCRYWPAPKTGSCRKMSMRLTRNDSGLMCRRPSPGGESRIPALCRNGRVLPPPDGRRHRPVLDPSRVSSGQEERS